MKILFVRHGESVDDLTNQYGGWADFPLTPNGHLQISKVAEKINDLGIEFELVLNSPLSRALETGRIIANKLSIPQKTFVYVKEWNYYGMLSGLNKDQAENEYPELVDSFKSGYVLGQEIEEHFIQRVKKSVEIIQGMPYENIVVVTHGGFLSKVVNNILGLKFVKAHDGGFILLESNNGNALNVLKADGIDYTA